MIYLRATYMQPTLKQYSCIYVPCRFTFLGNSSHSAKQLGKLLKVSHIVSHFQATTCSNHSDEAPVTKKPKIETLNGQIISKSEANVIYMCKCKETLYVSDIQALCNGDKLNDRHINFAQALLTTQFPSMEGLSCTLYQSKLFLN